MQEIKNIFGTGKMYNVEDLEGKVYVTSVRLYVCMVGFSILG